MPFAPLPAALLRGMALQKWFLTRLIIKAKSAHVMIGFTGRFGNAEPVEALLHPIDSGLQRDTISHGDVDRFHVITSPQNDSHTLAPKDQRNAGSRSPWKSPVLSNKQRLGASNRRLAQQDSNVASNSKKPRMCAAVAINQNQVWLNA